MAKRLRWTEFAKSQRKNILKYWNDRNKSQNYSRKLNVFFNEIALMILKKPKIGVKLSDSECRARLIRDYYIIYLISDKTIEIVSIWDTRQDPEKLIEILDL